MKRRQVLASGSLLLIAGCLDSEDDTNNGSFSETPTEDELESNFNIVSVDEDFEISDVSTSYEEPNLNVSLDITNVSSNPAIGLISVSITDTEYRITQSFTRETEPIPPSESLTFEFTYSIDSGLWERINSFSLELESEPVEVPEEDL